MGGLNPVWEPMPRSVAVSLFTTTPTPNIQVHLGSFESIKAGLKMMKDVIAILRAPGYPQERSGLVLYLQDEDMVNRVWAFW